MTTSPPKTPPNNKETETTSLPKTSPKNKKKEVAKKMTTSLAKTLPKKKKKEETTLPKTPPNNKETEETTLLAKTSPKNKETEETTLLAKTSPKNLRLLITLNSKSPNHNQTFNGKEYYICGILTDSDTDEVFVKRFFAIPWNNNNNTLLNAHEPFIAKHEMTEDHSALVKSTNS